MEHFQVGRHLEALGGRARRDALELEAPQVFQVPETNVAELGDFFVSFGAGVNRGGGFHRDVDGFRVHSSPRFEVNEFPLRQRGDIVGQHPGEVEVEVLTVFRMDGAAGGHLAESCNRSEHTLSSFSPSDNRMGNGAQPRFG